MASIFKKADPKDPDLKRWVAKIKVGDRWMNVSLRMVATAGTKRLAEARAADLQNEVKGGLLSQATREWLGHDAASRLGMVVGRAGAKIDPGGVNGWRAALDAYLAATDAGDTRSVVQGKVKAEQKTKITRKYKLRQFVAWAEGRKIPFMKGSFTETIRDYIEHRKAEGIAAGTLWCGDFTLACCWGDWMASKRICEPINRDRIREVMPPKPTPIVSVPTWQADLENLRFFHGLRLTPSDKGSDWKRSRSYYPVWSLMMIVRGLGCRPSEATSMSWETVDLERSQVRFLESKNKRARVVPILFQWVHDALAEAWDREGRPASGPVCRTWDGSIWNWDVSAANLVQRMCLHHDRPVYQLKKAQKLHIAHLIRAGFPPHVVAYWTDHSLSVQEKHYYQGDGYLPPEDGWDYAEFGGLSAYGRHVLSHTGYSRTMPA